MTTEEALKSIEEDGIRLGAGDFVDLDALKVAKEILDKHINGQLVEVVTCKNCKWMVEFIGKDSGKPCGYGRCDNPVGLMGIAFNESYCSYGEKK